ncbi:hypothetical protein [Yoonia sp. BS5-3]|uniref:Uncharacterized protein n=1 Tax=Yoonia phaeophyticola TaxID=3137369 RepID=A0ABZ2V866_9RHOB
MSLFAMIFAGSVAAQDGPFRSHDGTVFSFAQNQHGGVLTSIGRQTAAQLDVGDVLYLGRSCDAFSTEFGDGSWSRTNMGFLVEFPGLRLGFPDQAIDIVPGNRCRI